MASLVFDIFNIILLAIMSGVLGTWVYLIAYIIHSFRKSPTLERNLPVQTPKVTVIVPARNEESFITTSLTSIGKQTYGNYTIIVVDDSSTDNTAALMKEYALNDKKTIFLEAGSKPDDWVGKNWACYQGYLRSDGDLLLFTDADTSYDVNVISSAVCLFLKDALDALTLIPRLICLDPWTKITLPFLSTFLHSRYSPLRVNNPSHNVGYFFGSFYLIQRSVYQAIGTHSAVRNELVEDGALGSLVKKNGYKLKMVRGEDLVSAIWARDFSSLWNGLARLVTPLYVLNRFQAISIFIVTFCLFVAPFTILLYSIYFIYYLVGDLLLVVTGITSIIMIVAGMIEARASLRLSLFYAMAAPVAGTIIAFGFLAGVIKGSRKKGVKWRDRNYVYSRYTSKGFEL